MVYYDMEIIHPFETNDLVRVGQLKDGGYVINKRTFEYVDVIIGLGINADWSFEEGFVRRSTKEPEVYGYDFSVSADIFYKEYISRILYLFSVKFLLRLIRNPGKMAGLIRQNYLYAKLARNTHLQFPKFFDGEKHKFFQLGISNEQKDHFIRFDEVIQNLRSKPAPYSIFLKIDIEFSEYRIMDDVFRYSDRICGMVIEFHELDVVWEQFSRIMQAAKQDFLVTHVHGNNYGDFIPGTQIPVALEVTFLNKNIIKENLQLSSLQYPLPGLDYPNDPSKADLPLNFDTVR
jgi:hypothetical protein